MCPLPMGSLVSPPENVLPCETQCYICDKAYQVFILPVIYSGAMEFLESRRFNNKMPIDLTMENYESFVGKLAKDKDWLLKVFGKETVSRYQVTAFYFQLFTARIISFGKNGSNSVSVAVSKDGQKNKLFKNIFKREGIQSRASGRGGRVIPFKEVADKVLHARAAMNDL